MQADTIRAIALQLDTLADRLRSRAPSEFYMLAAVAMQSYAAGLSRAADDVAILEASAASAYSRGAGEAAMAIHAVLNGAGELVARQLVAVDGDKER